MSTRLLVVPKPIGLFAIGLIVACLLNTNAAGADEIGKKETGDKLFRERIAPILVARCQACHGAKKEGGYSVATASQLLVAGDSELEPVVAHELDKSELWRRLVAEDDSERMPVDADPLTASQLAVVKAWIESGATIAKEDLSRPLASLALPTNTVAPEVYPRAIPVNALAVIGRVDEVLVGGYAEVTRWKSATGELVARMSVSGPHVAAIAMVAETRQVIVSSGSPGQRGVIELLSLQDPAVRASLPPTADVAADIATSPDGTRLAIAGHDGSLRIAELKTDNQFGEVQLLTPHADSILAVAWSADGTRLITASRDRTAKLFDAESLELIASYDRHERAVGGVGFIGKRPVTYDETGRARMWSGDDNDGVVAERSALPRTLQRVYAIDNDLFIADRSGVQQLRAEKKKVSDGKTDDGKPKTKEVTRLNEASVLHVKSHEWVTSVAANESVVAAGTQQGTVSVWDRSNGELLFELNVTPRR